MAQQYVVSYLLQMRDRFSKTASKFKKNMEGIKSSVKKTTKELETFGTKVDRLAKKARNFGGTLTTRLSLPLLAFGGLAVKKAADIETLTLAFTSLLGSGEKATEMVKSLTDFAASTPFQLEGIGKATKQLLAVGVAQEDVLDRLKFLGDIAAGANVPLSDMAAIFGKAKSKGKAMTEELLQLSDRGIPIIDVLAEQMGVSKNAIFDMASQGKISFEILSEGMRSMSEQGGVFADQMRIQSGSIAGKISTLRDNFDLFLVSIGRAVVGGTDMKETLDNLIAKLKELTAWVEEHPKITKWGLALAGIAVVAGPLISMLGTLVKIGRGLYLAFAAIPALMGLVSGAFATASAAVTAFFVAIGPIGWAILALIALGLAVWGLIEYFDVSWEDIKGWGQKVLDFFKNLDVGEVLEDAFGHIAVMLLQPLVDAWKVVEGWGQDTLDFFSDLDIGEVIQNTFGRLADLLIEPLSDAWDVIVGWGEDVKDWWSESDFWGQTKSALDKAHSFSADAAETALLVTHAMLNPEERQQGAYLQGAGAGSAALGGALSPLPDGTGLGAREAAPDSSARQTTKSKVELDINVRGEKGQIQSLFTNAPDPGVDLGVNYEGA